MGNKIMRMTVCFTTVSTHPRPDMPVVPPSPFGYAQRCAPSLLGRHPLHLSSVRNAGYEFGNCELRS